MKLGTRKVIVAIVEAGDTLSKISEATGVSAERILFLNPLIKDPNLIFEGEGLTLLTVPEMPEVWFHREGMTGRRFGVTCIPVRRKGATSPMDPSTRGPVRRRAVEKISEEALPCPSQGPARHDACIYFTGHDCLHENANGDRWGFPKVKP